MEQLFKRALVFGDLHLGKSNDSERHNEDCLSFIHWLVKNRGTADAVIFTGDWFDNRVRVRWDTLDYSYRCLELLDNMGIPVYMIVGNHDMYYKRNRRIHALQSARGFRNIHVINEITEIGDCLLVPYMVGEEPMTVPDYRSKYLFGHFELPTFLVNSMREFTGNSGITIEHFEYPDAVFSGHFHKRQMKINDRGIPVWYTGNPFGHDYNDTNDRDRGIMFLDWGGEPEFLNFKEGPNFNRLKVSTVIELLENDKFFQMYHEKSNITVIDDVGIDMEDGEELREMIIPHVRSFDITFKDNALDTESDLDDSDFGSADISEIFVQHLEDMDTEGSSNDSDLLIKLFKGNINVEDFDDEGD